MLSHAHIFTACSFTTQTWDVNRSINSGQNFNSEQSVHIFSSCAFQFSHWLSANRQSRCSTAPFNCATVGVALITLLEHSDRAPDAMKSNNLGFMQVRTLSSPTLQAPSIRAFQLFANGTQRPQTAASKNRRIFDATDAVASQQQAGDSQKIVTVALQNPLQQSRSIHIE